jgi:hypothetical protein
MNLAGGARIDENRDLPDNKVCTVNPDIREAIMALQTVPDFFQEETDDGALPGGLAAERMGHR